MTLTQHAPLSPSTNQDAFAARARSQSRIDSLQPGWTAGLSRAAKNFSYRRAGRVLQQHWKRHHRGSKYEHHFRTGERAGGVSALARWERYVSVPLHRLERPGL